MVTKSDLEWIASAAHFIAEYYDDKTIVKVVAEDIERHANALIEEEM